MILSPLTLYSILWIRTPVLPHAFSAAADSTDLVSSFPNTVKGFLEILNGAFPEIVPSMNTSSGIGLITDSASYSSEEILTIPEKFTHCKLKFKLNKEKRVFFAHPCSSELCGSIKLYYFPGYLITHTLDTGGTLFRGPVSSSIIGAP